MIRYLLIFLTSLTFHFSLNAAGYEPPQFNISNIDLVVNLDDHATEVTSQMQIIREDFSSAPLVLDGINLKLISLLLNDEPLTEDQYQVSGDKLTIYNVPQSFSLTVKNQVNPKENTSLEGLYKSGGTFCTQNEAQGFRKITYFLDRPDIMSTYTTKIIANQEKYPVLLSNGNLLESGKLTGGKHYSVWQDPYKKPCYLFALVAGDLDCLEDVFVRKNGKPVDLKIFCERGQLYKCTHAMACLKKAMRWDEERYNLVCDLDTYMIVAINNFNAGAMENKGLNIFNASCILADPKTSTDRDFNNIERVIAHEYFHNWTGNRVTLRDWQELNVKESLTVFRDQEFSLDMNPRTTQRIEQVEYLKRLHFPQDSGPTAHAIRPKEPIEVRNLYSTTVYNKGPEVVRMLQTLLGQDVFNMGMAKYFELYDGQAVCTEQFLHAMEIASSKDLSQFKRWYEQKGTPHLKISSDYNSSEQELTLTFEQSNPVEGQNAEPLHFPFVIGLIDQDKRPISLKNPVLEISEKKQAFVFHPIRSQPTLSLNRDFMTPMIVDYAYTDQELAFLMANDTNEFNRWSASKEYSKRILNGLVEDFRQGKTLELPQDYLYAFSTLIHDENLSVDLKSLALLLPAEQELSFDQKVIQFDANYAVRTWMKKKLALENEAAFLSLYQKLYESVENTLDAKAIANRSLKNVCLSYLIMTEKQEFLQLGLQQFDTAENMTDQLAALSCLCQVDCEQVALALNQFHDQWKEDKLVMNKWLRIKASQNNPEVLSIVKGLLDHPVFDFNEANKQRALLGGFVFNSIYYHAKDGSGYEFMADQIIKIDKLNPSLASGLTFAFQSYNSLDPMRKEKMKQSLERLMNKNDLSPDTLEIVKKIYDSGG